MNFTIQHTLIPLEHGYATVDVQIVDGRIAAIAPHLEPWGTLVDGQEKLLLPGFINAHTHSSEMWQRGRIEPLPLELWLAELYNVPPLDPQQIYLSALGTAVETLLSGGTTVVDHLVLIPDRALETIEAAVRGYREVGIRAFIGPLVHDEPLAAGIPTQGRPPLATPAPMETDAAIALLAEIIQRFHRPDEGISIMASPTGPQLCTEALFKGFIALSDRYQLCRHTHLLETKMQKILADEKYGCSAVAYLERVGFLDAATSLAHSVWLDEADIAILARTRSTVVHNPLSNLRLGSGIAPVLNYLAAGVNVTFGCDGSSSNDAQDLLEVIKIGSLLHNITDPEYRNWIPPRQAVQMAALGGAQGLGWADQIGSLTVGKQADLVLYDLTSLSLLPRTDPLGLLVLGRPTQAVDSVWVKGQQVVAAGQMVTVDVADLRQQFLTWSQRKHEYSSSLRQQFEPRYRTVLNLP